MATMVLFQTEVPVDCPKCGRQDSWRIVAPLARAMLDEPDFEEKELWPRVHNAKRYAACPDCRTPMNSVGDCSPFVRRELSEAEFERMWRTEILSSVEDG